VAGVQQTPRTGKDFFRSFFIFEKRARKANLKWLIELIPFDLFLFLPFLIMKNE
jgi:hypothetical protein